MPNKMKMPSTTNLWRAALRMEGLGEAVTEDEIDMVSRAMSVLAQEGIEKGLSDEEYAEYLLEQVE